MLRTEAATHLMKSAFGCIVWHLCLCCLLQLVKGLRVDIHLVAHLVGHTVLNQGFAICRYACACQITVCLLHVQYAVVGIWS